MSVNQFTIIPPDKLGYKGSPDTQIHLTVTTQNQNFKVVAGNQTRTNVPAGGEPGQILSKISGTDFDMEWRTGSGGAVDSVNDKVGAVVLDPDDLDDSTTTHKFHVNADWDAESGAAEILNKPTSFPVEVPGDDTEVTFNDDGELGTDPGFIFDKDQIKLSLQNLEDVLSATAEYTLITDVETKYTSFGTANTGYSSITKDAIAPFDSYILNDGGNIVLGSLITGKTIKMLCAATNHEAHPSDVIATVSSDGINLKSGKTYSINNVSIPTNAEVSSIYLQNVENHGSGVVSGGTLTATGGVTFSVDPYVVYLSNGTSSMIRNVRLTKTYSNSTLYDGFNVVYINASNDIVVSDTNPDPTVGVLLGVIYTALGNTIIADVINTPVYCSGMSNRVANFATNAIRALVEEGCSLTESATPLMLKGETGTINVNLKTYTLGETTSIIRMYKTADFGWVGDAVPFADPTVWNDITQDYGDALIPVTATYWTKSLVYRSPTGTMYYVYGQAEYETEEAAQASAIPQLPPNVGNVNVFLATIVAQAEDTSVGTRIHDVRPYLPRIFGYGVSSSGISMSHGDLTDLLDDDHTQYFNETRGDARYAPLAEGVTNGDSHDHNGGDGGQIDHVNLSNKGTNTHAQIDTHISSGPHVTNGDSHDHNGGDGAQIDHVNLSNKGTNTHAQIDTHISSGPHVTNGDSHDHNGGDGAQIDHVNLANKGTNTHAQIDTLLGSMLANPFTNVAEASVSTPASGKTTLFVESTTPAKRFSTKDDAGTVIHFIGESTVDSLTNKTLYTKAIGTQSIATAGGTTTLTVASPYQTIFTGTNIQDCVLPNATTLSLGWEYSIVNNSTKPVTLENNASTIVATIYPGIIMTATCTSIGTAAGTWEIGAQAGTGAGSVGALISNDNQGSIMFGSTPILMSQIHLYGHSFFDMPWGMGTSPYISANQNNSQGNQFVSLLGGAQSQNVINHAIVGSSLTNQGRSHGGFCTALSQIQKALSNQVAPYVKQNNGTAILCWGINDIGNNTAANQSKMRTTFAWCLNAIISRLRASAIFPANTGYTGWTFGANYSNSTATNLDWNSGKSVVCTVVDSGGSSTATFTIPSQYHGEPICFLLIGNNSANSCIVTWGGTVTGTTGIIGTTTTINNQTIAAHGPIPVRFTAAANGLSGANAGQTITVRVTTISSGTFELDSVWIEAFKPNGVLVCNAPKPACKRITIACGDGVSTGSSTTFTSAKYGFINNGVNNLTDLNGDIIETDAQGALQSGTTISAVGSATSITLSKTANSSKTSIQFTVARQYNGYVANYSTNTNFSGATVANHTAADGDVTALNTTIANVVNSWDGMVKLIDLDAAFGGDINVPTSIYTWYNQDGLHLNDYGHARLAQLCIQAINSFTAPSQDDVTLGLMENLSGGVSSPGVLRNVICSGQVYTPEYSVLSGTAYTCVVGHVTAVPFYITEATQQWNTIYVQQTNAPTTSGSSIRIGLYNDPNFTGYPQNLVTEFTGSAFALGTTAGMKTVVSGMTWPLRPGLYWIALKVDVLGTTASQLRTSTGPNPYMPNWAAAGGTGQNMGWRLTGVATGAMPGIFAAGATIVATAPTIGVAITIL